MVGFSWSVGADVPLLDKQTNQIGWMKITGRVGFMHCHRWILRNCDTQTNKHTTLHTQRVSRRTNLNTFRCVNNITVFVFG